MKYHRHPLADALSTAFIGHGLSGRAFLGHALLASAIFLTSALLITSLMPPWLTGVEAGAMAFAEGAEGTEVGPNCGDIPTVEDRLACYDDSLECGRYRDDTVRLSCFDQAYSTWSKASGRSPVVKKTSIMTKGELTKGQLTKEQADAFGKPPPRSPDNKPSLSATVLEVLHGGRRIDYLSLDNNQIWRETVDSKVRFKKGQRVTIEPGILGSYTLHVEGVRRLVKVKRVK